jgi:CRISPR system Cascade subunit CasE
MYLSKLTLNLRDRGARRALADCQVMHATIMRAFPSVSGEPNPRLAFGLLYRVEPARAAVVTILAQSASAPDWSRLPPWLIAVATKPVAAAHGSIRTGQALAFRLRANPTKIAGERPGGGRIVNAHRVALTDSDAQLAWLKRAGERGGFAPISVPHVRRAPDGAVLGTADVPDVRVTPEPAVHGFERRTFGCVLFEGRLTVTDADVFRRTLADGVGRGKAYGFGLLSVAPARTA